MIVVTAADTTYFGRLINMLKSMRKNSPDTEVWVYDIGLKHEEIKFLQLGNWCDQISRPEKVNEKMFDYVIAHEAVPSRKVVGLYTWKPAVIKDAAMKARYGASLLWLDAGMTILKPLNPIFEHIDRKGVFFIGIGTIGWMCTHRVKDAFKIPKRVLESQGINAAIMGVKVGEESLETFIFPMAEYAKNYDLFVDDGTAEGGENAGRHDQTIFSIQARKLDLPFFKTGNDMTLINGTKISIPYLKQEIDEFSVIYHSRGDTHYKY